MATALTEEDVGGLFSKLVFDWTSDASGDAVGLSTTDIPGVISSIYTAPNTTDAIPSDNYDVVVKEVLPNQAGVDTALASDILSSEALNRSNATNELTNLWPGQLYHASGKLQIEISNAGDTKEGKTILFIHRTLSVEQSPSAGGSGDMYGPSVSVAGAIPMFANTTGKVLTGGGGPIQGIFLLPADASMSPAADAAGAATYTETSVYGVLYGSRAFDGAADEEIQWRTALPLNFDGTIEGFDVKWSAASGSGDVVWMLQSASSGHDDPLDSAWGSNTTIISTLTATDDEVVASAQSFSPGGTPAAGDSINFRLTRDADNALDTLNGIDAELIAVIIRYTAKAVL